MLLAAMVIAHLFLAQGYPYPGPPMWQQMPPDGAYGPPPGAMMPDGPFGPGSPYNAPGMTNPDGPMPGWMQNAPPVPPQGPMGPPGRPWGDPDEDDYLTLAQWGDDGWGDPENPAFGGRPPKWNFFDPRDRYGNLPEDRSGDYPNYWNAYPQPGAAQPMFPTGPMSPYEDNPWPQGDDPWHTTML